MADCEDPLPESQLGRAQWLADELTLCGHEEITAIDILDALASVGLKLVPDADGVSSHEYLGAHKSVIRSTKADQNWAALLSLDPILARRSVAEVGVAGLGPAVAAVSVSFGPTTDPLLGGEQGWFAAFPAVAVALDPEFGERSGAHPSVMPDWDTEVNRNCRGGDPGPLGEWAVRCILGEVFLGAEKLISSSVYNVLRVLVGANPYKHWAKSSFSGS